MQAQSNPGFTPEQQVVVDHVLAQYTPDGEPFLTMDDYARIEFTILGRPESLWISPTGETFNDNPFPAGVR